MQSGWWKFFPFSLKLDLSLLFVNRGGIKVTLISLQARGSSFKSGGLNNYYIRRPHHGWGRVARKFWKLTPLYWLKRTPNFTIMFMKRLKYKQKIHLFSEKKLWHGLLTSNTKTLQIIFSKFSKQTQTILIRLCEVIFNFYEI